LKTVLGAWPKLPSEAAFVGLAGEWVRMLGPHTEADPVAVLIQYLVAFGNAVGRGPYVEVESDRHHANLFAVLVGESSKARKGTAWGRVRRLLESAAPEWGTRCIASGLSSGEGLIWAVRDAVTREQPIKGNGRIVGYESVVTDAGVTDKRLLVVESELASALRVMAREGNTLSAVLRQAWETGNLRSLTKNSPAIATDAHISVVGHVTGGEVRRELTEIDMANGFANRFLWVAVRRSKALPEGGRLDVAQVDAFARRLSEIMGTAREPGRIERDDEARAKWAEDYLELSEGRPGLLGAITSRAEAQVMRLSLLYALLAGRRVITIEDHEAGVAIWDYCERSARFVFGETVKTSPDEQRRQRLVQVIAGRPERSVSVHWLANQSMRCYRGRRDLAERDLMALHAAGLGEFHDPPSGPATGRLFALNGSEAGVDADTSDSRPKEGHPQPRSGGADATHADRARREETFFNELEGNPK
jgi:hypothetical protein